MFSRTRAKLRAMSRAFLTVKAAATISLLGSTAVSADILRLGGLWEEARYADAIVLAKVTTVRENSAELDVIEAWKGPSIRSVHVSFDHRFLCPADARYEPSRRVVALLRRSHNTLWTVGGETGVRYPKSRGDEEGLRRAIRSALEGRSLHPTREWIIDTIRDRGSRADGLEALSLRPRGNDPSPIEDIEEITVVSPSLDETLASMLETLRYRESDAVTASAASAIETVLRTEQEPPPWIDRAMDAVERRITSAHPVEPVEDRLAEATARVSCTLEEVRTARKTRVANRWATLKQVHGLKPRVLEAP